MSYPASITIDRPERMANWRPIGQLILVLPHYVILHTVLNVVASITAIVAWFTVLATGKLPPGIAAFHATYVRYRARTFSYMQFLTDKYPPFDYSPSLDDPGGAGISVSVSPRLEGRNRLSVLFRFIVPFAWLTMIGMIGLMSGFDLPAWVWIVELVLGRRPDPGRHLLRRRLGHFPGRRDPRPVCGALHRTVAGGALPDRSRLGACRRAAVGLLDAAHRRVPAVLDGLSATEN